MGNGASFHSSSASLCTHAAPYQLRSVQIKGSNLVGSHRDHWDNRKDLAFEACMQAYALQQAVNARVPGFQAHRNEKAEKARRAWARCQHGHRDAMQANKKSGCHPQSVVTLSKRFKELRAGKEDVELHQSMNDPRAPAPAS